MTSLFDVCTAINDQYPILLRTNNHQCDAEYILRVVQAAPAFYARKGIPNEHPGLLSKSGPENGYTWPHGERTSHDAICFPNGERFDIIASSDNAPNPGRPAWQPTPRNEWRPSNVYVDISGWKVLPGGGTVIVPPVDPVKPPVVVPPVKPPYPADEGIFDKIGRMLEREYNEDSRGLDYQSVRWTARILYDHWIGGMSLEASTAKHRIELRAELGLTD